MPKRVMVSSPHGRLSLLPPRVGECRVPALLVALVHLPACSEPTENPRDGCSRYASMLARGISTAVEVWPPWGEDPVGELRLWVYASEFCRESGEVEVWDVEVEPGGLLQWDGLEGQLQRCMDWGSGCAFWLPASFQTIALEYRWTCSGDPGWGPERVLESGRLRAEVPEGTLAESGDTGTMFFTAIE